MLLRKVNVGVRVTELGDFGDEIGGDFDGFRCDSDGFVVQFALSVECLTVGSLTVITSKIAVTICLEVLPFFSV